MRLLEWKVDKGMAELVGATVDITASTLLRDVKPTPLPDTKRHRFENPSRNVDLFVRRRGLYHYK